MSPPTDSTNPNLRVAYVNGEDRPRRRASDRRVDWRVVLAVLGALGVGGGGAQLINTPWQLKTEAEHDQQEAKASLVAHEAREAEAHARHEKALDEVKADVKEILREMRGRRR